MSSPRLFFGEQGGAGQRGRGGGGGRNPASSQTLAFRGRQESCWKLSRSSPRPGLPESIRPQAGCWGRNPKCGSGLGGSPHTGHFYGAAKERFCKRAQPACLGCTKGGTEPPPEPRARAAAGAGCFILGGNEENPEVPGGVRRGSPHAGQGSSTTPVAGICPCAPPPSLQGHPCLCQTPSAAAEASSRARGGAVGALSILCQRLHPHRARTQPRGPPPPGRAAALPCRMGLFIGGSFICRNSSGEGRGGVGCCLSAAASEGNVNTGREMARGHPCRPTAGGRGGHREGLGSWRGLGSHWGLGSWVGLGSQRVWDPGWVWDPKGVWDPGVVWNPKGVWDPGWVWDPRGVWDPGGVWRPPEDHLCPPRPVGSGSSEGADPAPEMLCGAGEGSRASLRVHTPRGGFSPPRVSFPPAPFSSSRWKCPGSGRIPPPPPGRDLCQRLGDERGLLGAKSLPI